MHKEISYHNKIFLVATITILLHKNIIPISQQIISVPERKFPVTQRHITKFSVRWRNFLSHAQVSCHREKIPVAERYFLSREEISCHRMKLIPQIYFYGGKGWHLFAEFFFVLIFMVQFIYRALANVSKKIRFKHLREQHEGTGPQGRK